MLPDPFLGNARQGLPRASELRALLVGLFQGGLAAGIAFTLRRGAPRRGSGPGGRSGYPRTYLAGCVFPLGLLFSALPRGQFPQRGEMPAQLVQIFPQRGAIPRVLAPDGLD